MRLIEDIRPEVDTIEVPDGNGQGGEEGLIAVDHPASTAHFGR